MLSLSILYFQNQALYERRLQDIQEAAVAHIETARRKREKGRVTRAALFTQVRIPRRAVRLCVRTPIIMIDARPGSLCAVLCWCAAVGKVVVQFGNECI